MERKRQTLNFVNFIVTCVFLFFAVKLSDGGFATSINRITANLDLALLDLNDHVNYTNFTRTEKYMSSTEFCPKGMAGFYNLTVIFLNAMVPRDILVDGLITIKNKQVIIGEINPNDILAKYWGVLLIVLVLLLLVILLPLCGLCFCCCRCCGNCGARSQPGDKKRDLCKKVLQGAFLIALGTGLLFCVVCAFQSNQQLQDGVNSFPANMRNSVADSNTYLNSTKNEATHLLVNNYNEFANVFMETMDNSSNIVMAELENYSKATAMSYLANFVENIPNIEATFNILKEDTNKLRVYASQLNDAMRKVKKDLLLTLEKCSSEVSECSDIKKNISILETSIDFNRLPDVSDEIDMLKAINVTSIHEATQNGKAKLELIKNNINVTLSTSLSDAKNHIESAGNTIKTNLKNITTMIDRLQEQINKYSKPYIQQSSNYINEYGKYAYYGGLAISCILLLVTLCLALGLICGICGKRPDGYSDNCCNKGAGGQFLICAVMIMFTFGIVISVMTLAMFLVGVSFEGAICYPIRNPDKSNIFRMLDENIKIDLDTSISVILKNCYQNKSVYETFNLKSKFDVENIQKEFNIDSYLERLQLADVIPEDFQILSDNDQEKLKELKGFNPNVNLDQFKEELKANFTNFSLDKLSTELQSLIDKINLQENSDDLDSAVSDLQLSVLHINTYNEKLLIPMKNMANNVIDLALQLDNDIKMNHSSFSVAVDTLIQEIDEAQEALVNNGPKHLQEIAEQFKETVTKQVNSYLFRVGNVTMNELGQCGPLSLAINGTLTSTCDKILLPWNGFWFSLLWSLILFIPTIIISVKLASLYQKFKGHYVETEYLYDTYADRGDSIPLNSRGDKRNKKKNKKSRRYEERPQNMGGEVVAREFTAGGHASDGRYADMAPKHWEEFPNGGPPQYHRAPTEFERPPPYYYPPNTTTEP